MGCVEYWRGLHVDLHHTHTQPLQEDEDDTSASLR